MSSLKIPRVLFDSVVADLRRPHAFAGERVGFLYCRPDRYGPGGKQLMAVDYLAVEDGGYIDDPCVGARIGSAVIRAALQKSLDTRLGAFHIHEHPWGGRPRFSFVDEKDYERLIPSFCRTLPDVGHGAIVLSLDSAVGLVWLPGASVAVKLSKISVVGFPTEVWG